MDRYDEDPWPFVPAALAAPTAHEVIKQLLRGQLNAAEAALHSRLQRAKDLGDLPRDTDPAGLARY